MSDPKSERGARNGRRPRGRAAGASLLAGLLVVAPRSAAASEDTPERAGTEVFHFDTALGRIDYHAGRGLRLGNTGLTIGGFAIVNAERLEGGESRGELEGPTFLFSFEPVPFLRGFAELETTELAHVRSGQSGIRSTPGVDVERLYGEAGLNDALNLRLGKFQTPIGRWNVAPAEPFVWTTSEPLIIEDVFDDKTTGAMLRGSFFPRDGALSYSLYGAFFDPIDPDAEAPPAKHSAGAYLEWASLGGWSVGASYFASETTTGKWHHLGGADLLWHPTDRVELTVEGIFGEAPRENGMLTGFYAQAVVETLPTLYAVGRYEHFEPAGDDPAIDLLDVGFAWVPFYWLRLKADYRFADHLDERSAPGLRASFSILF
ncbi:MAG: hypothetical protein ACREXX_12495 [Gammaproteobacteria bacterium]